MEIRIAFVQITRIVHLFCLHLVLHPTSLALFVRKASDLFLCSLVCSTLVMKESPKKKSEFFWCCSQILEWFSGACLTFTNLSSTVNWFGRIIRGALLVPARKLRLSHFPLKWPFSILFQETTKGKQP